MSSELEDAHQLLDLLGAPQFDMQGRLTPQDDPPPERWQLSKRIADLLTSISKGEKLLPPETIKRALRTPTGGKL